MAGRTLAQRFQLPSLEVENEADRARAVGHLEIQAELMARVPVSIPLLDWQEFTPRERLIVAEAYERQRLNLAIVQAVASKSSEAAAAAYAPVDGGASLVRAKLAAMAEKAAVP